LITHPANSAAAPDDNRCVIFRQGYTSARAVGAGDVEPLAIRGVSVSGPISMFVPATVIAILALPLALNLVPPNRIYGYRTTSTLANRGLWFRINRVAGLALIAASAVALSLYLYHPGLASGRSLAGVLVLILPVLSALVGTGMYARVVGRNN
jgi:hypothetical protein